MEGQGAIGLRLQFQDYLKIVGLIVSLLLAARYVGKREASQDELTARVQGLETKLNQVVAIQTERDRLILDRLSDLRVDLAALKAALGKRREK